MRGGFAVAGDGYLSGTRAAYHLSPQGERAPWGSELMQGPLLLAPATWQLSGLLSVLPPGARRIKVFRPLRRPGGALPLHPTAFYKRLAKISPHCGAGADPLQRVQKTWRNFHSVRDGPAAARRPAPQCGKSFSQAFSKACRVGRGGEGPAASSRAE